MTIIPVNGTILVQQGCSHLNKLYEEAFLDTQESMHKAYEWASEITLSWHMETFALSMDEACAFLGISRPACQ